MTFQTEFPHFDAATLPAIPADWTDISYRNDICPSFSPNPDAVAYDKPEGIIIFVDYENVAQREFGLEESPHRFTAHKGQMDAREDFGSNDWAEIVAWVAAKMAA